VISNGDIEQYRDYHVQRGHLRVHAVRYRDALAHRMITVPQTEP
jgi:hypothetical protein